MKVGPLQAAGAMLLAEHGADPSARGVIGRLATWTGVEVRDDSPRS